MIVWHGESRLNRERAVAILTGLEQRSVNQKTGDMLQLWILPADEYPRDGQATVCGDCKLINNGCYVFPLAPAGVWKKFKRGEYPYASQSDEFHEEVDGRMIRLGAWGDPCALPLAALKWITRSAKGWTGYTHQWHKGKNQQYRELLMASVDNDQEALDAQAMGWRTFRIRAAGTPLLSGEVACPASAEMGHKTTCEACGLCDGLSGMSQKNIAIVGHGPLRKRAPTFQLSIPEVR